MSEWQTAIEALMLRSRGVLDHRADHPRLELMMQQVPVLVPVAAAPLKAAEFFTFFERKTGNECPALTTIVDEVRREPDCETGGKTDEENLSKTCSPPFRIMMRCGGDVGLSDLKP